MTGRVIIITGANTGIGFEAAKKLCEAGNDVILACRDEEKGKAAVESILKENPNALATFLQLDLADMASIKKFVEDFHALGKKLNVLVNNAGLFLKSGDRVRQFTKDNFELTMGTNYLGPFLLTHLLLEDLKKTGKENGDSRVVMVSSQLHDVNERMNRGSSVQNLDLENFFLDKDGTYSGQQAYKNSKVAMVMSTYSLARQLEGTGVSVTCMNPGFIPTTDLSRHASSVARFMLRYLMAPMFKLAKITRTMDHGSKMIVDLSISEKYKDVSGKYFDDFEEKESSEESRNEDLQSRLYELSARYCCLDGYEALTAPAPPPPEEKPVKSPKVKTPKKKSKEEKEEVKEAAESGLSPGKEGPDVEGIKFVDEDDKQDEEKPEEGDGEPVKVTVTIEDTSKGDDAGNQGDDGKKNEEVKTEEIMGKEKAIEQEEAKAEVTTQ